MNLPIIPFHGNCRKLLVRYVDREAEGGTATARALVCRARGIMARIGGTGWFTKYFMSCFSGILSMKFSTY